MSGEQESTTLTRDLPFEPGRSGLLVVDMQNLCAARGRGEDADGKAPPDDDFAEFDGLKATT